MLSKVMRSTHSFVFARQRKKKLVRWYYDKAFTSTSSSFCNRVICWFSSSTCIWTLSKLSFSHDIYALLFTKFWSCSSISFRYFARESISVLVDMRSFSSAWVSLLSHQKLQALWAPTLPLQPILLLHLLILILVKSRFRS